jgi:hypothetical protein
LPFCPGDPAFAPAAPGNSFPSNPRIRNAPHRVGKSASATFFTLSNAIPQFYFAPNPNPSGTRHRPRWPPVTRQLSQISTKAVGTFATKHGCHSECTGPQALSSMGSPKGALCLLGQSVGVVSEEPASCSCKIPQFRVPPDRAPFCRLAIAHDFSRSAKPQ